MRGGAHGAYMPASVHEGCERVHQCVPGYVWVMGVCVSVMFLPRDEATLQPAWPAGRLTRRQLQAAAGLHSL